MDAGNVEDRVTFVLPRDMKTKVSLEWDEFGRLVITMDLHGLSRSEAERVVTNIIAVLRIPFTLALIHGYNRGTVLKEFIHRDLSNPRIKKRYCNNWNPGETFLEIA